MKTHVIIGMILVLSGCWPSPCSSQPTNISSAGHVIVPAKYVARAVSRAGIITRSISEWKMEESDVSAVENSINSLFAKPDKRMQGWAMCKEVFPLSDYYMKYAGVLKDGKKLIIGQGYHKLCSDPKLVLKSPEQDGAVYVEFISGGGSYYFTVVYDAIDKKLVELTYNSPL